MDGMLGAGPRRGWWIRQENWGWVVECEGKDVRTFYGRDYDAPWLANQEAWDWMRMMRRTTGNQRERALREWK